MKKAILAGVAVWALAVVPLVAQDRVAFAGAVLRTIGKQADGDARKFTLCAVALTMADRAGEARKQVIAEVFAVVDTGDLAAVAAAFAKGFSQERNGMSDEDYLQAATNILAAVAERLKGQADAAQRFAYAVAAFLGGAKNPDAFRDALFARIGGLLAGVKSTPDGLAGLLPAALQGLKDNDPLARRLFPSTGGRTLPGTTGKWMLLYEMDRLSFVGENRPPRGYQNQSVGK
jgi:hypothetical protein